VQRERQIVEELLELGCGEFVVCGGARNAGLVALLEAASGVRVWRHFEERGAAFFALGRVKDSARPCVVITTSGTAVAECLPAVIEASYSAKPLVIVSADRPESFRGSGAPQTIDQESLFGVYAEKDLAKWNGRGPLHVNVSLEEGEVRAEEWKADVGEFSPERMTFEVRKLRDFLDDGVFRGLVAMVGGLEEGEREEVYYFLKELGIPVVADVTSGLREALGGQVISERSIRGNLPGRILRLGEVPVGRLWRDLEGHPGTEVLSICQNGLPGLARDSYVIRGEVNRVLRGLGQAGEVGDVRDDFLKARPIAGKVDELLEAYPDSEPGLIRLLSVYATTGEGLFLGNSLPIREWNEFAQRETPYALVRANRGSNGIDGELSTGLGASANTRDSWGVFGDLTALYDLAAPSLLGQVVQEGRVLVVINNGGGRIFDRLPRLEEMSYDQRKGMVQPQEVDLKSWAGMWGMAHRKVTRREDFDQLDEIELAGQTLLLELIPSESQTEAFWSAHREVIVVSNS